MELFLKMSSNPPVDPENAVSAPAEKSTRKWKKILLSVLIVVLVLFAVLLTFRDMLIKHTVCQVGSYLTGTTVKLEKFSSSLSGKVEITGLSVGNPENFNQQHNAIEFAKIRVSVDVASLFSDVIKVNEITVRGMNITWEPYLTQNNIGVIQANLNSHSSSGDPKEKAEVQEESSGEKAAQKQVFIALISAQDTSVSIANAALGRVTLPLPPVQLTDIGGGKPLAETLSDLTGLLLESAAKAGSNAGAVFSSTGEAVSGAVVSAGNQLTDAGKSVAGSLEKSGKDILKTLNFLPGKK